jgi:hypothetical protein
MSRERIAVRRQGRHARLLFPVGDEGAALRPLERESPHHREALRVQARRLERQIVAVAFPQGRNDDDAADTSGIHLGQQHVPG